MTPSNASPRHLKGDWTRKRPNYVKSRLVDAGSFRVNKPNDRLGPNSLVQ